MKRYTIRIDGEIVGVYYAIPKKGISRRILELYHEEEKIGSLDWTEIQEKEGICKDESSDLL